LLGSESQLVRARPGPIPQLQLRFEQIKQLPRQQQEFVLDFVGYGVRKGREKAGRTAVGPPFIE